MKLLVNGISGLGGYFARSVTQATALTGHIAITWATEQYLR